MKLKLKDLFGKYLLHSEKKIEHHDLKNRVPFTLYN